jgi:hypothetical protein
VKMISQAGGAPYRREGSAFSGVEGPGDHEALLSQGSRDFQSELGTSVAPVIPHAQSLRSITERASVRTVSEISGSGVMPSVFPVPGLPVPERRESNDTPDRTVDS